MMMKKILLGKIIMCSQFYDDNLIMIQMFPVLHIVNKMYQNEIKDNKFIAKYFTNGKKSLKNFNT